VNDDVRRRLAAFRVRHVAPLTRRLRQFWTWWTGELAPLVPPAVRQFFVPPHDRLVIEVSGEVMKVSRSGDGPPGEVLRLPLPGTGGDGATGGRHPKLAFDVEETILVLPEAEALTRPLSLPLAAEENLREVLSFEMDRYTPFPASEVYYDCVITDRDAQNHTLDARLVFSPRTSVDRLLEAAGRAGATVDVVTARAPDGSNLLPVNLLPADWRTRRGNERQLRIALAGLCAALAIVVVTLPIVRKDRVIAELTDRVEAASAVAHEGNRLRRELESMAETSRFLAEKKAREVMAVELIDEISRVLSDETWLYRLDVSHEEVHLHGESTVSASLIEAVESSPLFENARFRSQVVQVAGTAADRFHLSADITREEQP
jgi:general secretion pathway protein L